MSQRYLPVVALIISGIAPAPVARSQDPDPGPRPPTTARFMGGMGLTVWPMRLQLGTASHEGVGLGISGRVKALLWERLRLQVGLLQGSFEEEDLSAVKRSVIFGAAEFWTPLFADLYLTVGARIGGDHLEITQTVAQLGDEERRVRNIDGWTPVVEPLVTVGWLLAGKYHLELENGIAVSYRNGAMHVSYVAVIGVYFKMFEFGP